MLLEQRLRSLRLDDGAPGGGGPGSRADKESPYKPEKPAPISVSESEAQYHVQVARFGGNHEALSQQFWRELLTMRRRNREIREELGALKARNPQGSLVLVGEDVTKWNSYKPLGTPAEIKAQLDEGQQIKGELASAKKKETRAVAAKALGYSPAVLGDRLDVAKLDVEMREQPDATGQKKQVPFARPSGDEKAQWEPLATVAERDWPEHLPALKSAGGPAAPSAPVVEFPNNGAGSGSAGSTVDRFIANRDKAMAARPNPLGAKGTAQKSA